MKYAGTIQVPQEECRPEAGLVMSVQNPDHTTSDLAGTMKLAVADQFTLGPSLSSIVHETLTRENWYVVVLQGSELS